MPFRDFIAQLYQDIRVRKVRIFIAVMGIAWGTMGIVLFLSFGEAFGRNAENALRGMGDALLLFEPLNTTKPYAGMKSGRPISIMASDVIEMGRALPEISLFSPEMVRLECIVHYGDKKINASVTGVSPDYATMRTLDPMPGGRFLNRIDVEDRRRVIFLGDEMVEKLFDGEYCTGETVDVNGRPFVVVGSLTPKLQVGSYYFGTDSKRAFIPYTTFISIWGNKRVDYFVLRPDIRSEPASFKRAVYRYLGKKWRFDPSDEAAVRIWWDTTEISQFSTFIFWAVEFILGLGTLLTLGVGGIGVINVMLLIVRERTRDIGIWMAIGARDFHIISHFLMLAIFIAFSGGFIGIAVSSAIVVIIQNAPVPEAIGTPAISGLHVVVTAIALAVVGIAAGIYPGIRASKMDPIRALGFKP